MQMNGILSMLGQFGNWIAVLGIVLGAIECFLGYRIFKIIVGITGFVVGASLGALLASADSQSQVIILLAGLLGGVVGAVLSVVFYFIGIFLIGAVLGAVLGYVLFSLASTSPRAVVLLILAVIAGIVAVVFQKLMIIVSTAFGGAWGVVSGVASFARLAIGPLDTQALSYLRPRTLYPLILCWLALGLIGVVVQYRSAPAKRVQPSPPSTG
jgi:hypothetical protein